MIRGARPFTSHVKMMTLTLTLPHAGRWFYQREIQHITGIAYTPVRAALLDLEAFGLLRKRARGGRPYYSIDKDFFLYEEYKRIVFKTTGLGDHLRFAARQGGISAAFLIGAFAEGGETTESPVEFCIVGTIAEARIRQAVGAATHLTQKSFRHVRLAPGERPSDPRDRTLIRRALDRDDAIFVVGRRASVDL